MGGGGAHQTGRLNRIGPSPDATSASPLFYRHGTLYACHTPLPSTGECSCDRDLAEDSRRAAAAVASLSELRIEGLTDVVGGSGPGSEAWRSTASAGPKAHAQGPVSSAVSFHSRILVFLCSLLNPSHDTYHLRQPCHVHLLRFSCSCTGTLALKLKIMTAICA